MAVFSPLSKTGKGVTRTPLACHKIHLDHPLGALNPPPQPATTRHNLRSKRSDKIGKESRQNEPLTTKLAR